ncbi:MAG: hypothetical protein JSU96_09510, partial [Acidobacteriota bacterium]
MLIWIRRTLALWLLSVGIVLLLFPFDSERSGSSETPVMVLEPLSLIDPGQIPERFRSLEVMEANYQVLEQFPSLLEAVMRMNADFGEWSCTEEDWTRFAAANLPAGQGAALLVFRAKLFGIERLAEPAGSESASDELLVIRFLGEYDPLVPDLTEEDLREFPAVLAAVREQDAQGGNFDPVPISLDEWDRFHEAVISPDSYSNGFRVNGKTYQNAYTFDYVQFSGSIENLDRYLAVSGLLGIIVSVFLFRRLYFRRRGIQVNPPWVAVLWDGITVALLVVAAYPAVDTALVKILHLTPSITDDFSIFMGNFCFYFGAPFVSLFTSRLCDQSVTIGPDGIVVAGLLAEESVSWAEMEGLNLSSEYIAVGRLGLPVPKELQKCLKIDRQTGDPVFINEPQVRSVKSRLVSEIENL